MTRVINLACCGLGLIAFVLNLTANGSNEWWVALKPQEFERIGLWEICFNHYRHRFDYYGKVYTGCWWHFSPETRMLFSWVSTPWYQAVQAFATLSMIFMFFAFLALLMLVFNPKKKELPDKLILQTSYLTLTSGLLISYLTVGARRVPL